MALSHSPLIVTDGLVFMYDTGNRKSYVGEPTVNLITNSGTSNTGWVGYGWTGSQAISNDYSNTYEFTATNGWHNRTFDTGVTSGGTIYVTFEYKLKQQQTTQNQLFVLNGTSLGSYTNWLGSGSMSFEWQTFSGSFTANANSSKIAIGPRGTDSSGLTDIVYIRNLQVEQKSHVTPFVNGTRSATEGLIDRTNNTTIDISNASFDSDAQMTFDGTDDYINVDHESSFDTNVFTIEAWFKSTADDNTHDSIVTRNGDVYSSTNGWSLGKLRNGLGSTPNALRWIVWGTSAYTDLLGDSTTTGNWIHAVGVSDGATLYLYQNGVLKTSSSKPTGNIYPASYGLKVGANKSGSDVWNGDIAAVKMYNQALTSAEVLQNFNATKSRFGL